MSASPTFRQLLPAATDEVDLGAIYAYPEEPDRPWLRANMVASADGCAVDSRGSSRGLSSAADRTVLALLRGLSDVILVGAGTARAEAYRPVRARPTWEPLRRGRPATPRIAVVSRTLNLHTELLDAPDDARTLVFTTSRAAPHRIRSVAERAEVVVLDTDGTTGAHSADDTVTSGESVPIPGVVSALAERGLYRVLCEGGPHLLGEVTSSGLLDELCLTLSPVLCGPGALRVIAGDTPSGTPAPQGLDLAHLLTADGTLFARYRRAVEELTPDSDA
ncbi:dihydrofolate reductase family protein [Lipingzhangella sp. LS1_29]|uniref:Dihydrofolate reductase family protein n=1 Tax=Lipingzhangella rawalii TaxID=2055835 RepID=A0ABU2H1Y0_9ACTN|nr:dihydrofolate reductase family protein [Lipingzhangella rawalii]MDS1268869.1 dihydrofolate reductase family protein [Lipingzhangella rawalii]